MKDYLFSKDKDILLKKIRGIGFDEIIEAITQGKIIKVINHHNTEKYPTQKIYLVEIRNYIFSVPFVEEKDYFFLKTIIPNRKYAKKYIKNYKLIKKYEKPAKKSL